MDKSYDDSLTLLEMIVLTKEVLISRLEPYRDDPEYKERKKNDDEQTTDAIFDEVEDTLSTHFPNHRGQILRQFLTLIVRPILDEVKRVGIANAASYFDDKRFDKTAKDSFGEFLRQIENSVIVPNSEDKEVAKTVLAAWSKEARLKQKEAKLTPKQRRLSRIKTAVEKVQKDDDVDDKKDDKEDVKESIVSDLKRKMQGKVSGKAQIKRVSLSALQRMVDGIKDMDKYADSPEDFKSYVIDMRKDLIDAIKMIKAVED